MLAFKTEGIILKRRNFGEADRILTVFSQSRGKISVLAKGVRRITSRRGGNVELLNRVQMFLHPGKNLLILTEAVALDTYPKIKEELTLSTYGFHLIELVDLSNTMKDILKILELSPWGEIEKIELKANQAMELERILRYYLEKVIEGSLKSRQFLKEVYGGLAGTWDYGPMGSILKKNLKDLWWKEMVEKREDVVGLDAAIIMNPKAWEASGHLEAFTDPLVECKICHKRFREDKPEEVKGHELVHKGEQVAWTEPKNFNLLVKTYLGVTEDRETELFLRGEITNGVQVNFKNVVNSTRIKIPFGIAQMGKAFRNEITPGNFTFRSREFEQMELQFYIRPDNAEGEKWFEYWKAERLSWYKRLGIKKENLRHRDHESDERAHYARKAEDIEYKSSFGWKEFEGIHHRGDYDLKNHGLS